VSGGQGRRTTIDLVPSKLELPPTVLTVNVTEFVRFRIPDLLAEHGAGVVEQLAPPLAPPLHAPETLVARGVPLLVTPTVTVAVQVDPLLALDALRETVAGAETVTLLEELPAAP
jgi:hypothetical protein